MRTSLRLLPALTTLSLVGLLVAGCGGRQTETIPEAPAAGTPPDDLRLSVRAEIPASPAVVEILHDAGDGRKAGESVTFTVRAKNVPEDAEIVVEVGETPWRISVPRAVGGDPGLWSGRTTVPDSVSPGTYSLRGTIRLADGSQGPGAKLVSDALTILPSLGACGEVQARLTEFRIPFDFDKSALRSDARSSLRDLAGWLSAIDGDGVRLRVEGHADERGTIEYNLALSQARAQAARDFLLQLGAIEKARTSVKAWGEEKPLDNGHDEQAWARNRRAEFFLECPSR